MPFTKEQEEKIDQLLQEIGDKTGWEGLDRDDFMEALEDRSVYHAFYDYFYYLFGEEEEE